MSVSGLNRLFRRVWGFAAALCLAITPGAAMAAASQSETTETTDQMIARAETLHPAELYRLAGSLLQVEGRADEAVKWFYIGQLRYRFQLRATQQPSHSNENVLFAALSETVGRPVNEYAFGDVDEAARQIGAALEWDAAHDNPLTSKSQHAEALTAVRKGLEDFRDHMLANKEDIRRQRTENGLTNR